MEKESDTKQHGQTLPLVPTTPLPNASPNGTASGFASLEKSKQEMFRDLLKQLPTIFPKNKYLRFFMIILALILLLGCENYLIIRTYISTLTSTPIPTPEPNLSSVIDFGYVHYGVIRNIHIISVYTDTVKGLPAKFVNTEYTATENQIPSANCSPKKPSDCQEVFKDADEGTKTDSGNVFLVASDYAANSGTVHAKKPVTLVVSGIRNTPTSQFRNILLLIPQDS